MQKVKKASYNQLKEVLEEMYDHIHSQDQDIKYLSNENQYLSDYIDDSCNIRTGFLNYPDT